MEGRVEFSTLDRVRLLGSLQTGSIGPLGPPYSSSEPGHSSSIAARLSTSVATAAAAAASVTSVNGGTDITRPTSPTTFASLQGQYFHRCLPPASLHSSGANYTMMTNFLTGGHSPDALKALVPDMHWSPAHDGYARYFLNNYHQYLPYLPATESLSMFAHNSVGAAHVQSQALAAQHRIYDLHKEAMCGSGPSLGMLPAGFFGNGPGLHYSQASQMEATNLSLSMVNRCKQNDKNRPHESGRKSSDRHQDYRSFDSNVKTKGDTISIKQPFTDAEKVCSPPRKDTKSDGKDIDKRKCNGHSIHLKGNSTTSKEQHSKDKKQPLETYKDETSDFSYFAYPSPIDSCAQKSMYEGLQLNGIKSVTEADIQDKPENLCLKDKHSFNCNSTSVTPATYVKTQSVVTNTTVTVTCTQTSSNPHVTSSNLSGSSLLSTSKGLSPEALQHSLSSPDQDNTVTTYSLPYYHNLYARSQNTYKEGMKVHATTFVPEVGTVTSHLSAIPKSKDSLMTVTYDNIVSTCCTSKDEHCPQTLDGKKVAQQDVQPVSKNEANIGQYEIAATTEENSNVNVVKGHVKQTKDVPKVSKKTHDQMKVNAHQTSHNENKLDTVETHVPLKSHPAEKDYVSDRRVEDKIHKVSQKVHSAENVGIPVDRQLHISKKGKVVCKSKELRNNTKQAERQKSLGSLRKENFKNVTQDKQRKKELHVTEKESMLDISAQKEDAFDFNHNSKGKENHIKSKPYVEEAFAPESSTDRSVCHRPGSAPPATNIFVAEEKKEEDKRLIISKKSSSKIIDGSSTPGPNIPVGIAVARQRPVVPKGDTADEKLLADEIDSSERQEKSPSSQQDIKPGLTYQRPLKVIRPATKPSANGPGTSESRNELPANLIVTGGSNATTGVFWPDDPASRQIAAQFHTLNTGWFGQLNQAPFNYHQPIPTSLPENAGQMPLSVPAGYKLAQDSLTGQILLIPSGPDIYDVNRVWSGYSLNPQVQHCHSSFPPGLLPMQGQTQQFFERPANTDFQSTLAQLQNASSNISYARAETVVKEEKPDDDTNLDSCNLPDSSESYSGPHTIHSPHITAEKDKHNTGYIAVSELSVSNGQQGNFPYSSPQMSFVFNPEMVPISSNLAESQVVDTDIKTEQASVQSRGTSPMLPPTDSNDESEEANSPTEIYFEEKNDESVCDDNGANDLNEATTADADVLLCSNKEIHSNDKASELVKINDDASCQEDTCVRTIISSEKISVNIDDETLKQERDPVEGEKCRKEYDLMENKFYKEITEECKSKEDENTEEEKIASSALCALKNSVSKTNLQIFPSDLSCSTPTKPNEKSDSNESYNPYKDPVILFAAGGLELLSALAEKRSLCSNPTLQLQDTSKRQSEDVKLSTPSDNTVNIIVSNNESSKCVNEKPKEGKPRIKFGYSCKASNSIKTNNCGGVQLPADDEVIDSLELEMRMRLAELQRRYREKQKELSRFQLKKDNDDSKSILRRGPGRPRKRKFTVTEDSGRSGDNKQPVKMKSGKQESSPGHKKKRLAEMLVDRVFRKTGSSFKIPLSKKTNLIAPARIEFHDGVNKAEKLTAVKPKPSVDIARLIKKSRLSQWNGRDRSFWGGFWKNKDEKKATDSFKTTEPSTVKQFQGFPVTSGLGLLAEYASKSVPEKKKKKRKEDDESVDSSPTESPNKKRKPGRPKKCNPNNQTGVTETIVAKQSKHRDFFLWQKREVPNESSAQPSSSTGRNISLEGKTPLKPIYLDEWNLRRSERIFLSDSSPQPSPNNTVSPTKPPTPFSVKSERKLEPHKLNLDKMKASEKSKRSTSIHDLSKKLKKKYSKSLSQKCRDQSSLLIKVAKDIPEKKIEENNKGNEQNSGSESEKDDDKPLSYFKTSTTSTAVPSLEQKACKINKTDLRDGLRVLLFSDGLFHEGSVKAIQPPDIYGVSLENERKTRSHIYSQEEILQEAILDVQPSSRQVLPEGTRICAYWSQQFSCLYPGIISKASPNPSQDSNLINVEFDDGDSGKIPIDHVRLLPQDFPQVEYDPNPLLLLTKRRRTTTTSESSEPRKSLSESKPKRGPGRPPKLPKASAEPSEYGDDEDVFTKEIEKNNDKHDSKEPKEISPQKKSVKIAKDTDAKESKDENNRPQVGFPIRQLWEWSGKSTKRPGLKGKAKKEYYKAIVRGKETIMVGDCAVFLSTGRQNLPYIGRIESFWEGWGGQMIVKVKWFYHPEETKGGKRLANMKGALFKSDHEDENDVQTISHQCEVLSYDEYKRKRGVISSETTGEVYYLAGSYQPTIGLIKFEAGVI